MARRDNQHKQGRANPPFHYVCIRSLFGDELRCRADGAGEVRLFKGCITGKLQAQNLQRGAATDKTPLISNLFRSPARSLLTVELCPMPTSDHPDTSIGARLERSFDTNFFAGMA